jgi:hypothetical protein
MKHAHERQGVHDVKEGAARNDSASQQGPADPHESKADDSGDKAAQAHKDAGGAFTGDVARHAHEKSKSVSQRKAEGTFVEDTHVAPDASLDRKIDGLEAEVQNAVKRPGNAGRISGAEASDLKEKLAALGQGDLTDVQKARLEGLGQRVQSAIPPRA